MKAVVFKERGGVGACAEATLSLLYQNISWSVLQAYLCLDNLLRVHSTGQLGACQPGQQLKCQTQQDQSSD
jgi:hypothetical protein